MVRVLTNIRALQQYAPPGVRVEFEERPSLLGILRAVRSDGLLLTNPGLRVMLLAILTRILSAGRTRIYFYDILLSPGENGWKGRAQRWICQLASRLATRIYLVHLDYETYARELGVPASKFEWIGFKCNNFERLATDEPRASPRGDYVLACGQSYRDYPTFISAMERLSIPACILLPPRSHWSLHGTWFEETTLPPNVKVVEHDGRVETWDSLLRHARIVALPLRQDVIQPAGISVSLEAMAFGKALIMSDGPLTIGDLFSSAALVVKPGDPEALAGAVDRLWHDDALRQRLAGGAAALARRMGGVHRMCTDLLDAVITDFARPGDIAPRREREQE